MTYSKKKVEIKEEFSMEDEYECKVILRNVDNIMDKKGPELQMMVAYYIVEQIIKRFDDKEERDAMIRTLKINVD